MGFQEAVGCVQKHEAGYLWQLSHAAETEALVMRAHSA